jgi:hypothetical protein
MHVLQCCRAKTEPFLAVSDALANQCTQSYHVASVVHMYQIWKENSVRRVWVVKISAGMVLIASANSNGDKGAASTVSALAEAGSRALSIVTVGLFGAALADADDEPTQDRASKKLASPRKR